MPALLSVAAAPRPRRACGECSGTRRLFAICAGARFGPAFLFDVATGERKRMFETKGLVAVAFSGDGTLVAGACIDEHNSDNVKRDVKIWSAQTGKVVHTIPQAGG